jgi:hypothetical protein
VNDLDTSRPHPARRYNYWLGGKDNFAADRDSGDAIAEQFPAVVTAARENRRFVERAVGWLAETGVRQFIDVGCGIPLEPYVHEIAARHVADVRVVYVDNDPLVITHARALMDPWPPTRAAFVLADVAEPHAILRAPELAILNMAEPVALLLFAVLHFLDSPDIHALIDALPAGSYVALTHATEDLATREERARVAALRAGGEHGGFWPRTLDQIAELLRGLCPVEPGIVPITDWRPERDPVPHTRNAAEAAGYAVVARKP